jgi:2,4-didehydro-3-deoxy-L-rhamnonate hydrolase
MSQRGLQELLAARLGTVDVGGEPRNSTGQLSATMIFDVATLVSYVSEYMTLLPGDVVNSGTPAGVGLGMKLPKYLLASDVVELGIESLGQSRQRVVNFFEEQHYSKIV